MTQHTQDSMHWPLSDTSVGKAMEVNWAHGTVHPGYRAIADAVSAEVAVIASRNAVSKAGATPLVMTVELDAAERALLEVEYPEFRLVDWALHRPGHAYHVAANIASNALMLRRAETYSSDIIHVGGSLLHSLLSKAHVHVERNVGLPSTAHETVLDMRHTQQVFGDYAELVRQTGNVTARVKYDQYLARRDHVACTNPECTMTAGAMCVDLSRAFMSPSQAASAMLQCGAQVGFFVFPYSPAMLFAESGKFDTGVFFRKDYGEGRLRFAYPEGASGEEDISLADWGAWLTEHVVTLGRGVSTRHYKLELSKPRGCYMHAQMVESEQPGELEVYRHTLECDLPEPQYVIKGWALRDLTSDPERRSSWRQVVFTAPAKVVSAVFAYGMQLPLNNFSRYAIRRQLMLYDRVTIEGVNVTRGYTPGDSELDLLTTLLHAEIFVERYESGQLSSELMMQLKNVSGFGSASKLRKTAVLALAGVLKLWDGTIGAILSGVSWLFGWIRRFFSPERDMSPTFSLAPERVAIETLHSAWVRARGRSYTAALRRVQGFSPIVVRSLRGSLLASAIAERIGADGSEPHDASVVSTVHFGRVVMNDQPVYKTQDVNVDFEALKDALVSEVQAINGMDQESHTRDINPTVAYQRVPDTEVFREDQDVDEGYVSTLNDVYNEAIPGVSEEPLFVDVASLAFDDQDRQVQVDRMKVPRLPGAKPADRDYYRSKVLALGAPKRQETKPELLSAVNARNLAAPKVSLPQDESVLLPEVFEKWLVTFGVDGAAHLLDKYQREPVYLSEPALRDWAAKARTDVVTRVVTELRELSQPLAEADIGSYKLMLKADFKPPLSTKPLKQRIEPQTIVFLSKWTTALCSSIFRELAARFLSLVRPEVHVNLNKNMEDIVEFLHGVHQFDSNVNFVENDFSKYDKSQDGFAFRLEAYVFRRLGLNEEFLAQWMKGHEDCHVSSVCTGISLWLRWQRKSGDPTTAFGNVMFNMMSVAYSYDVTQYQWALFMGDDSLIATDSASLNPKAVQVLAEVFNLQAKTFVTEAPYFASWFFMFDSYNRRVVGCPDPIKWIERKSMMVSAIDPQWEERYVSARDTAKPYMRKMDTYWLYKFVVQRYNLSEESAKRLPAAIYTAVSTFQRFRGLYEAEPYRLTY